MQTYTPLPSKAGNGGPATLPHAQTIPGAVTPGELYNQGLLGQSVLAPTDLLTDLGLRPGESFGVQYVFTPSGQPAEPAASLAFTVAADSTVQDVVTAFSVAPFYAVIENDAFGIQSNLQDRGLLAVSLANGIVSSGSEDEPDVQEADAGWSALGLGTGEPWLFTSSYLPDTVAPDIALDTQAANVGVVVYGSTEPKTLQKHLDDSGETVFAQAKTGQHLNSASAQFSDFGGEVGDKLWINEIEYTVADGDDLSHLIAAFADLDDFVVAFDTNSIEVTTEVPYKPLYIGGSLALKLQFDTQNDTQRFVIADRVIAASTMNNKRRGLDEVLGGMRNAIIQARTDIELLKTQQETSTRRTRDLSTPLAATGELIVNGASIALTAGMTRLDFVGAVALVSSQPGSGWGITPTQADPNKIRFFSNQAQLDFQGDQAVLDDLGITRGSTDRLSVLDRIVLLSELIEDL